ncbi:MAG: hypothetical protein ACKVPX_17930 [Myxococcaceae bacterium]
MLPKIHSLGSLVAALLGRRAGKAADEKTATRLAVGGARVASCEAIDLFAESVPLASAAHPPVAVEPARPFEPLRGDALERCAAATQTVFEHLARLGRESHEAGLVPASVRALQDLPELREERTFQELIERLDAAIDGLRQGAGDTGRSAILDAVISRVARFWKQNVISPEPSGKAQTREAQEAFVERYIDEAVRPGLMRAQADERTASERDVAGGRRPRRLEITDERIDVALALVRVAALEMRGKEPYCAEWRAHAEQVGSLHQRPRRRCAR